MQGSGRHEGTSRHFRRNHTLCGGPHERLAEIDYVHSREYYRGKEEKATANVSRTVATWHCGKAVLGQERPERGIEKRAKIRCSGAVAVPAHEG